MSSRRESAYSRGGHSRNQTLNHDNTDALHYSLSYKEKWMAQQRSVHAFLQHANTFYVKQTHKHKQHFKICVAGVPVVVLRWLQLREKWSDASSVSNTAFERVLGGPCWLLHSVSEKALAVDAHSHATDPPADRNWEGLLQTGEEKCEWREPTTDYGLRLKSLTGTELISNIIQL